MDDVATLNLTEFVYSGTEKRKGALIAIIPKRDGAEDPESEAFLLGPNGLIPLSGMIQIDHELAWARDRIKGNYALRNQSAKGQNEISLTLDVAVEAIADELPQISRGGEAR